MADRTQDQQPHANHHSFHIPNAYARSSLRPEDDQYSIIPGTEDAVNEDIDATLPFLSGVEASETWQTLSRYQRGLVRAAFGILGAIVLLPFNTLITPSEYYRALLKDTPREASFMSWLIAVYNISCIIFGFHATATMHKTSIEKRIKLSSSAIIAVLLLATILASVVGRPKGTDSSSIIFGMMLLLTTIVSASTSYLQLAVVTLANAYGPSCMGTMLSGQGVVGASVSLVQLIAANSASSQSMTNPSAENIREAHRAAIGFFAVNTGFMIFGLSTFLALQRTCLYHEMQSRLVTVKRKLANHLLAPERTQGVVSATTGRSVSGIYRYMNSRTQQNFSRIISTQKKVLLACLSIAYIFTITLSIFPSLTARIHSTNQQGISDIVFVALHFFIFNVGDFTGRSFSSVIPRIVLIRSMLVISICCVLRTVFIPLFLLCNVTSSTTTIEYRFGDKVFFFFTALLGLTNGLLATNIFIIGPRQENLVDATEQDLAAGLISWWLTLGLAVGSLSSFIVTAYV